VKQEDIFKATHRDIAKMLVKAMPVQDSDFRAKVEFYIKEIGKLPAPDKLALKAAYVFSAKVPRDEREDFYQELALVLLKAKADPRLAYSIARCDWLDWWKRYYKHSQFNECSLNQAIVNDTGDITEFGELLVGDCEFEARLNGDMDGKTLYDSLPDWVQRLVDKRLNGYPIRGGDRQILNKWINARPTILAEYQAA